jgi:hypothetical protein
VAAPRIRAPPGRSDEAIKDSPGRGLASTGEARVVNDTTTEIADDVLGRLGLEVDRSGIDERPAFHGVELLDGLRTRMAELTRTEEVPPRSSTTGG